MSHNQLDVIDPVETSTKQARYPQLKQLKQPVILCNMTLSLIRWLQLLMAILGLGFSTSSQNLTPFVIVAFVLALIYEIILFVSHALGRTIIQGRNQTLIEIAIVCGLLLATIHATITNDKHINSIITVVCGYILSALFVISAFDGA